LTAPPKGVAHDGAVERAGAHRMVTAAAELIPMLTGVYFSFMPKPLRPTRFYMRGS
jgi:hypothetical protein